MGVLPHSAGVEVIDDFANANAHTNTDARTHADARTDTDAHARSDTRASSDAHTRSTASASSGAVTDRFPRVGHRHGRGRCASRKCSYRGSIPFGEQGGRGRDAD